MCTACVVTLMLIVSNERCCCTCSWQHSRGILSLAPVKVARRVLGVGRAPIILSGWSVAHDAGPVSLRSPLSLGKTGRQNNLFSHSLNRREYLWNPHARACSERPANGLSGRCKLCRLTSPIVYYTVPTDWLLVLLLVVLAPCTVVVL